MTARKPNPMPRAMRGKLGGLRTFHLYGRDFYSQIGTAGGNANVEKHGVAQMHAMSAKARGYDVTIPSQHNKKPAAGTTGLKNAPQKEQ